MKLEYAELIAATNPEIELRTEYSGRGMYGETTAAVVFPDVSDLFRAIAEVASEMNTQEAEQFAQAMGKIKTDGMGRSQLAY